MIDGTISFETVPLAWQLWHKQQQKKLELAKTNFAQEWARATAKDQATTELPKQYECHKVVFLEEAAKRFPPSRPKDLAITLKDGAPATINCKIYPLSKPELAATKEVLDKNVVLGYIEQGESPWSTPWFFTGKKDGGLQPLQDYQVMNSWTIHDVYPIP